MELILGVVVMVLVIIQIFYGFWLTVHSKRTFPDAALMVSYLGVFVIGFYVEWMWAIVQWSYLALFLFFIAVKIEDAIRK